jgi:type I restriction enzyme S subunit
MKYEALGNHLRFVDTRNVDMAAGRLLGISIDKYFMPSVANVIGTDLSSYKFISKGQFACNPMHVGRDERLPIALYTEENPAIVSPAYFLFQIIDEHLLLPEYLMMWFRRAEFDHICWRKTDGSVRGGITWDDFCEITLPVPSLEKQESMVKSYRTVADRILLKRRINDNLEATGLTLFKKFFIMQLSSAGYSDLPLYNCAEYINGTSFEPDEYSTEGLPIVKIAELKNGITPDTQFFIGNKDNKYLIDNHDILFSWSGNPDTSIDTFIWPHGKAILNQHTFKMDWHLNGYAYTYFLLKYYKPEFAKAAKNKQTTGLGHVTVKDLQRLTVPYCKSAVKKYNQLALSITDMIFDNLIEIKHLTDLAEQIIRRISVLK